MRQQAVESGERRRAILDAAFALIAAKGLEGLRTRDIARRAGINIATFHYYFATKEALLVAVVQHVRDVFTAPDAARPSPGDAVGLQAYFAATWRRFRRDPGLVTVLQELMLRAKRDPTARAAMQEVQDHWNRAVERILRHGIATGSLRPDLDARAGARVVTAFTMGAALKAGLDGKPAAPAALTRELQRWLERGAG